MKKLLISLSFALALASTANGQLTNLDFETWQTDSTTQRLYPTGWNNLANDYCIQSTTAFQGNYALTTSIWYYYAKTAAVQRHPINYRPTALDGYYMYTDNEVKSLTEQPVPDTALVSVFLTRTDAITNSQDTIGTGVAALLGSTTYSHFAFTINYANSYIPDSITLILDPSVVRRHPDSPYYMTTASNGYGSYFTIDALSLKEAPSLVATSTLYKLNIFPNPATDILNIELDGRYDTKLYVTDLLGRVRKISSVQGNTHLNINDLNTGTYFLSIHMENGSVTRQFIKQ